GASGVVIDAAKGLVLTNDHVVQGATRVVVVLHDGGEREVTQVRRDPKSDLALLTIDGKGLSQAEWGDSDALETGDWVLAIGQPFALPGTLTAGIISGKGRGIGAAMYEDFLQTDAAINPGNSGGPLINLKGEVIGINTAIKTLAGGYDGVGFAIPSARARRVAADLAAAGKVRRAYLGVQIGPVDRATADRLGEPGAVAINGIAPGSPADEAGLRRGDVLVRLGDQPLRGIGALQNAIEVAKIGAPLALTVDREGEPRDFTVTPREQPETFGLSASGPQAPGPFLPGRNFGRDFRRVIPPGVLTPPAVEVPGASAFPALGLRLAEQTRAAGSRPLTRGERPGLLITGVDPGSPADVNGLEAGMVITDVDKQRVESLDELRGVLQKRPKGHDPILRVLKGAKPEFRVLIGLDAAPKEDEKPEPKGDKDQNPPRDAPKTR
ncbi:MAG: trypsin-like peptidase domain-containing protein, partial [Isosphaeraceae bacterium]|nr:trypsin-like peptidase domain-containing protein [Isosphaeraceae bacterium]